MPNIGDILPTPHTGWDEVVRRCSLNQVKFEALGTRKFAPETQEFTVPVTSARLRFCAKFNRTTGEKITEIKALRTIDHSLGLVEAKNFVEGESLSVLFRDYPALSNFVDSLNIELARYDRTGRVQIIDVWKENLVC